MCRREMMRQDEDIEGKTKIIADYKTICSQLSQRIERTQAAHKEEIESIKKVCGASWTRGRRGLIVLASFQTYSSSNGIGNSQSILEQQALEEVERLQKQTRALELELAQTKLKLVESECKVQVRVCSIRS